MLRVSMLFVVPGFDAAVIRVSRVGMLCGIVPASSMEGPGNECHLDRR